MHFESQENFFKEIKLFKVDKDLVHLYNTVHSQKTWIDSAERQLICYLLEPDKTLLLTLEPIKLSTIQPLVWKLRDTMGLFQNVLVLILFYLQDLLKLEWLRKFSE